MRQEWARLLFQETPVTWATGEDLHMTYSLTKFAGLRTFVAPIDPDNSDTWYEDRVQPAAGSTPVEPIVSATAAPAGHLAGLSLPDARRAIATELWVRGQPRACLSDALRRTANVLLVAETPSDAEALAPVAETLRTRLAAIKKLSSHPSGARLWLVAGRTETRDRVAELLGFDVALFGPTAPDVGAFDLAVGAQWPRRERSRDTFADALASMGEVLDAVSPPLVIVPARETPVVTGVSVAAQLAGVPVIAVATPNVAGRPFEPRTTPLPAWSVHEPAETAYECAALRLTHYDLCTSDEAAVIKAIVELVARARPAPGSFSVEPLRSG